MPHDLVNDCHLNIYSAINKQFPSGLILPWRQYIINIPKNEFFQKLNAEILPLAQENHITAFGNKNDPELNYLISDLERLQFNEWQAIAYQLRMNGIPPTSLNTLNKLKKVCFCFSIMGYQDNNRKLIIGNIFWNENEENAKTAFDQLKKSALQNLYNSDIYHIPATRRNFILRCISDLLNGGIGIHLNNLIAHLEHVLPQKPDNWINKIGWTHELINKWTHKIGNLVYLPQTINSAISNLGWEDKRNAILINKNLNINAYGLRFSLENNNLQLIEWSPTYVQTRHNQIIDSVSDWLSN